MRVCSASVKHVCMSMRVTFVAVNLITEVRAVVLSVALAATMDTGAVITLELIWTTSRTT